MPHETTPPAGQGQAPAEKTIYITMTADGAISVGMKPMETAETAETAPEMQGEQASTGAESDESYMKPAANIDEALEMTRQMLEGEPSEEMSVEQAFNRSFNDEPQKRRY